MYNWFFFLIFGTRVLRALNEGDNTFTISQFETRFHTIVDFVVYVCCYYSFYVFVCFGRGVFLLFFSFLLSLEYAY